MHLLGLMDAANTASVDAVLALLKEVGYINIEIAEDGNSLFSLFADFANESFILSVSGVGFEVTYDDIRTIASAFTPAAPETPEAEATAEGFDIGKILGAVGDVFKCFTFGEGSVKADIAGIVEIIMPLIEVANVDMLSIANGVLSILDIGSIEFSNFTAEFGKAVHETKDQVIENNIKINPFNFDVKGTIVEGDKTYNVSATSDLNVFALFELAKVDFTGENMLADMLDMLQKVGGYFNFAIYNGEISADNIYVAINVDLASGKIALIAESIKMNLGLTFDFIKNPMGEGIAITGAETASDNSSIINKLFSDIVAFAANESLTLNNVENNIVAIIFGLMGINTVDSTVEFNKVTNFTVTEDTYTAEKNIIQGKTKWAESGRVGALEFLSSMPKLNFSIGGQATGYDSKGKVNRTYGIDVQAEINTDVIAGIFTGTHSFDDKDSIVKFLKALGYFHLEVNETTEGSEGNIITIHMNSADGFAVVQFDIYNIDILSIKAPLAIGGVYQFDALIDAIMSLTGGTPAAEEGGIDVVGLILGIIKYIHLDNTANEGVMLEITNIFGDILGAVDSLASVAASFLTGGIEKLYIQADTPVYGNCQKIGYDALKPYQMQGDYDLNKDVYIKEITSVGEDTELYFDASTGMYFGTNGQDSAYKFNGIDVNEQPKEFYGFIMGMEALGEIDSDGNQKVKMYVAQASEMVQGLAGLAGFGLALPSMAPLMGVMTFETTVNTYDSSVEKTITETEFYTSEEAWDVITINIGELTYTEKFDINKFFAYDKDGNDVTESVAKKGLFSTKFDSSNIGTYDIKYVSGAGEVTATIILGKAQLIYDGELALGSKFDISKVKAVYAYKDKDGKDVYKELKKDDGSSFEITADTILFTIGDTSKLKLSDIVDASGNILKNLHWNTMVISFATSQKITSNLGNSISVNKSPEIEIGSEYTFKIDQTYDGMPIDWTFTKGENKYFLKYANGQWNAVDQSGAIVQSIKVSVTYTYKDGSEDKTVVVATDSKGIIVTPDNIRTSYSRKYDIKIVDGEYTYEAKVTSYTIYLRSGNQNNSSMKVNSILYGQSYVRFATKDGYVAGSSIKFEDGKLYIEDANGGKHDVKFEIKKADGTAAPYNEKGELTGYKKGDTFTAKYVIEELGLTLTSTFTADADAKA